MSDCIDPKIGMLLHAYELGALSPEDDEAFELHILKCDYCVKQLSEFEVEADLIRKDESIKDTVLKSEYDQKKESVFGKFKRCFWPRVPLLLKPAITYLIILFMAIPCFRALISPTTGFGALQAIRLNEERASDLPVLFKGKGESGTVYFRLRDVKTGDLYQVQLIEEQTNKVVESEALIIEDNSGLMHLYISLNNKRAGIYKLTVLDNRNGPVQVIKEFFFSIKN